jgi:hypothetical protein
LEAQEAAKAIRILFHFSFSSKFTGDNKAATFLIFFRHHTVKGSWGWALAMGRCCFYFSKDNYLENEMQAIQGGAKARQVHDRQGTWRIATGSKTF